MLSKMFGRAALMSASAMLTMPGLAIAQSAEPATSTDETGEILVTARRVSERLQDVPVAITALSNNQIRQKNITTIKDLQSQAPSLFISTGLGGPSAANIALRAQVQGDTLLTTDPAVGIYINGVNLPRQLGLRSAFYDIEQIQVLKGPQGTLFGKNTTGGAILLTTKRPDLDQFGGFAELNLGNFDLFQVTGAVNAPLVNDTLAIRLAGNVTKRDGFGEQGGGRDTGNQNEWSARATVLFEPGDAVKLLVTADKTRVRAKGSPIQITGINQSAPNFRNLLTAVATELGLPNPSSAASQATALNSYLAVAAAERPFRNQSNRPQRGNLDLSGISADLSVEFSNLTFRSITGYRHSDRDDIQDYDTTPFAILEPQNLQKFNSFTQEIQLLNDPENRFSWIIGAFYSREKGTEGSRAASLAALAPNRISRGDFDVLNKSQAVFGQANYKFTDQLRLTAGARYTHASEDVTLRNRTEQPVGTFLACNIPAALVTVAPCTAFTHTSASDPNYLISLDWRPRQDLLFYARTATSFRAGGLNTGTSAAQPPAGAGPFAPEKTTDYEIGMKGEFFDRLLQLNLATYYTEYKDIQRTTVDLISGTLVTRLSNAAKGRVNGVEVETILRPARGLSFQGSGSWTHARYLRFVDQSGDRSGEAFPIPKYQFTLGANYSAPVSFGEIAVNANYRWQSQVNLRPQARLASSVTQPEYGLLDGRISLRLTDWNAEIALFGKNLTDKVYKTNCLNFDTSVGYNVCFIGDRRTFGVSFLKRFGGG